MKKCLPLVLIVLLLNTCSKDKEIEQFQLTTEISPLDTGSISPAGGTFDSGEEINLTATPAEGYTFKNWSGGVSSRENPLIFVINSDTNIAAIFIKSDSDSDGVSDDVDQCPETVVGETADAEGCSETQKDTDGDGISDNLDECPDTLEGDTVGPSGCPPKPDDSDDDGVINDDDLCPLTTSGEIVDENGCSNTQKDSDGDSVADDSDQCPETAEGEAVDELGCSDTQIDRDNDGVNNDSDECPDSPKDEAADDNGCSESQKDTDNDGIGDDSDKCSETPEGAIVDEQGCLESQKDSDDDGIKDDIDKCPETPVNATVDKLGCSDTQKDGDGDGVSDDIDECPLTAEGVTVNENGCAETLPTYVPDDVFEQHLINLGYDDVLDNYVITANISGLETLSLNSSEPFEIIADLTGLEAFTSLTNLHISNARDHSYSLHTEKYPYLTNLSLSNVSINTLEIGKDSELIKILDFYYLRLDVFKAVNTTNLESISFDDSNILSAIITGNTNLVFFYTFDTILEKAVISDNQVLKSLTFADSGLNELDFSNNPALESFRLALRNNIEFPINFSTYPNLTYIEFRKYNGSSSIDFLNNILLETLIIEESDELTTLDLSNNDRLVFSFVSNENLICIKVNQEQLDNIPTGWEKHPETSYSLNCPN